MANTPSEVQAAEKALLHNSVAEDLKAAKALVRSLGAMRFFGLARQYLALARRKFTGDLWLGQQHAVYTYKDPDLALDSRLSRALCILNEVDPLESTSSSETLGIAGAIHKYKWNVDGLRENLERSYGYYSRGYQVELKVPILEQEPPDRYAGINCAFVLDLLAAAEQKSLKAIIKTIPDSANMHLGQARKIREEIRETVGKWVNRSTDLIKTPRFWTFSTLAEACFGLACDENGKRNEMYDDEARQWIVKGMQANPTDWEFETFARQLAAIGALQDPVANPEFPVSKTLGLLLGDNKIAIQSLRAGKLGLALSGGGFRAALFHIGVLARLAEIDVLRHVEVLSCVSGGSIAGTFYYLEVKKLLQSKEDTEIKGEDYVEIVHRLEENFLNGVQKDLRNRLFSEFSSSWASILRREKSQTQRLGELFEKELYSLVSDDNGRQPRVVPELRIVPKGARTDFAPKTDNWRRAAKVPILILNATTLNTGHNWQFTATWMGEPPTAINTEIDANSRFRRMYYWQPERHKEPRLGYAVAASAAVPLLFDPLDFEGLYEGQSVRLCDGGVNDNQGISGLLGEDCSVLLVSDASGQLTTRESPSSGHLGVVWRANDILQERMRGIEYRDAESRARSGLIRSLMFVHLTKDLEGTDVPWIGNVPPAEPPEVKQEARDVHRTNYGLLRSIQSRLARLRTDLDSFTDREAYSLMLSGYRMTKHEFPISVKSFGMPDLDKMEDWRFLKLCEQIAHTGRNEAPEIDRALSIGENVFGKVLRIMPILSTLLKLSFAVSGFELIILLWIVCSKAPRTAGVVVVVCFILLACVIARARFIGKAWSQISVGLLLGCGGFLAFKIYLKMLSPYYLEWGRVVSKSKHSISIVALYVVLAAVPVALALLLSLALVRRG